MAGEGLGIAAGVPDDCLSLHRQINLSIAVLLWVYRVGNGLGTAALSRGGGMALWLRVGRERGNSCHFLFSPGVSIGWYLWGREGGVAGVEWLERGGVWWWVCGGCVAFFNLVVGLVMAIARWLLCVWVVGFGGVGLVWVDGGAWVVGGEPCGGGCGGGANG
ncbi:hypothetical protein Tco_0139014 [Tanacetum coccineum]